MKFLIAFCILFSALTMNAQSIAGTWNTGQDNTKIQITESNSVYSGKVVSSDNDQVKIGKLFLKEVKSVGGEWKGKIYSPKKDTWYNATIVPKGEQLLVTVKSGMASRTITWKKA